MIDGGGRGGRSARLIDVDDIFLLVKSHKVGAIFGEKVPLFQNKRKICLDNCKLIQHKNFVTIRHFFIACNLIIFVIQCLPFNK